MKRQPLPPWWQSLLAWFGIISLGIGAPVQIGIVANYLGGKASILLLLFSQVVPTLLFFFVERLILRRFGAERALALLRGVGVGLALLIFMHLLPQYVPHLEQSLASSPLYTVLKYGLSVGLVGLVFTFRRRAVVSDYLAYLGGLSVIWTVVFAQQVGLFWGAWQQPQESAVKISSPAAQMPPVFLLFFDGMGSDVLLRDGQVDGERFPNFAALAQDSVFFVHATSNYGQTELSFPTMLTGQWGHEQATYITRQCPVTLVSVLSRWTGRALCKGTSAFFRSQENILSVLRQRGYKVVEYQGWFTCRNKSVECIGRGWFSDKYPLITVASTGMGFIDGLVPKGRMFWRVKRLFWSPIAFNAPYFFRKFTSDIQSDSALGKVFFVHILLPHEPYVFDKGGIWHPPPFEDDLPALKQAYERQTQYVDTLLGQFLRRLKGEGIYEQAVVVVTSDHGPRPLAQWDVNEPQALSGLVPRVPLLIKAPGLAPGISTVDYQHIDFKPTLLDMLGLPPEEGLPGVSAFAPARPIRPKIFYWGGNKYIASEPTGRGPWLLEGAKGKKGSGG